MGIKYPKEINCPACNRTIKYHDNVYLDKLHTIIHEKCFPYNNSLPVIDRGSYGYIIGKYDFFKELLST